MFQTIKQIAKLFLPKDQPVVVPQPVEPEKSSSYLTTTAPAAKSEPSKEEVIQSLTETLKQTAATQTESITKVQPNPTSSTPMR